MALAPSDERRLPSPFVRRAGRWGGGGGGNANFHCNAAVRVMSIDGQNGWREVAKVVCGKRKNLGIDRLGRATSVTRRRNLLTEDSHPLHSRDMLGISKYATLNCTNATSYVRSFLSHIKIGTRAKRNNFRNKIVTKR